MSQSFDYPQTPISPGRDTTLDRSSSYGSLQHTPPDSRHDLRRKPIPLLQQPELKLHGAPASPVSISPPRHGIHDPETASIKNASDHSPEYHHSYLPSHASHTSDPIRDSAASLPIRTRPQSAGMRTLDPPDPHSRASSASLGRVDDHDSIRLAEDHDAYDRHESPALHYHAFDDAKRKARTQHQRISHIPAHSVASSSSSGGERRASQQLHVPGSRLTQSTQPRPVSTYTLGSDLRGRTLSPFSANGSDPASPGVYARDLSSNRRSPASRPVSYIDLLNNIPYNQQTAPSPSLNNSDLQTVVGNAASLLDPTKTLEMYRQNVKKTNDPAIQYEFAIFMLNAARQADPSHRSDKLDPAALVAEAKQILHRLADRAYPFAQYYLADGYASGLFSKDSRADHDHAFPLFVAAGKHGHAEAGYRAALCYEFAWGCARNFPKAVQFHRNAASKNHPGAATRLGLACLRGDMGLAPSPEHQREGIRWLKRAQESADRQYNAAPYHLGLMHLTGRGDEIFKDEAYAAQLLTQAAELGHADSNLLMGQAYENGLYGCPRDAALSVHFYNGAATHGNLPEAMMALCAWYMVGAEPVLDKDEAEACAWAKQAAELGHAKAQYAVGYFTEMGIGCRRDPLEANVWYVRAADQGNDMASQRLQIIRAAAGGETGVPMAKAEPRSKDLAGHGNGVNADNAGAKAGKKKILGIF